MGWRYEQSTGILRDNSGAIAGVGYSGKGKGKNNPETQSLVGTGPIPRGLYMIGPPYDSPTHGPFVLHLSPDAANKMFGRSGFLLHGDSRAHPGAASDGCIIMPRDVRESVWNSADHSLEVVA